MEARSSVSNDNNMQREVFHDVRVTGQLLRALNQANSLQPLLLMSAKSLKVTMEGGAEIRTAVALEIATWMVSAIYMYAW